MAFVLPGGDYESALRMAGASNFMEALESGVDRQMRRRAARQQIQQSRDAYDRQKSLEIAILQNEELSGVLGGGPATTTGSRRKGVAGLPGVSLEEALLQSVADSEENIALQGLARKRLAEEEAALAAIEATRADPGFTSEEIWYPQRAPAPAAEEAPRRRVRRRSGPAPVAPPAPTAPPAAVDEEWLRGLERAVEGWDPTGESRSSYPTSAPGRVVDAVDWRSLPQAEFALATPRGETTPGRRISKEGESLITGSRPEAAPLPGGEELLANAGLSGASPKEILSSAARFREAGHADLANALEAALSARINRDLNTEEWPASTEDFSGGDVPRIGRVERRDRARRAFDEGLRLVGEGDYSEAADSFEMANYFAPSESARLNAERARKSLYPKKETFQADKDEEADASTSYDQMVGSISPVALGAAFGLGGAPEEEVSRPSQLGRALSRWTGQAVSAAEGAAEEFGVSPADKVSDDQLEDAISALTTGSSGRFLRGKSDAMAPVAREKLQKFLPGIDELSSSREFQRSTMKHALEELERRQETLSLAKPPKAATPDDTVELKDAGGTTHKVVSGDTVSGIANSYGSTIGAIVKANPSVFLDEGGKPRTLVKRGKVVLSGKDLIYPGEGLRIPTGEGAETGGEAGAVDSRKDAPKGTLAELLAKQGEKATTIEGLRAELQKLQDNQPETPVNPFQKFGRDIAYLPSLKAVAFATQRAQQGDFSMINQMAGRVVKNYELDGLFADYRDFVSGTRRKANEIYASRVLEQKTAEQKKKLGAINAATIMARTQFREAGYSEDEAQLFSSYYGDLYSENPEQARAWSTTLNQMGKDERAAERKRIRRGRGGGSGGGYSGGAHSTAPGGVKYTYAQRKKQDDIIARAKTRLQKLKTSRRGMEFDDFGEPIDKSKYEDSRAYGELNADITSEETTLNREMSIYDNMLAERGMYYVEDTPVPLPPAFKGGDPIEWALGTKFVVDEARAAKKSGDWDTFEKQLADSPSSGINTKNAELIRNYFEHGPPEPRERETPDERVARLKRAASVDTLSRGEEVRAERAGVSAVEAEREAVEAKREAAKKASTQALRDELNVATVAAEDALLQARSGDLDEESIRDALAKVSSSKRNIMKFVSAGAGYKAKYRDLVRGQGGMVGGVLRGGVRPGVPATEDIRDLGFLEQKLTDLLE